MEPWRTKLDESDSVSAWDLFIETYRKLIFATIKHVVRDHDEVLDVFASVCEALRADDLARLRRYTESAGQGARFSTWLVAVVRNQTIDWLRQRDGRPRTSAPSTLSPVQKQIFDHITTGRSHVETYEIIRTRGASGLSFSAFLRELAHTYRALNASQRGARREQIVTVPLEGVAIPGDDPMAMADASEQIARALETLPPDERLALLLFVVDEMPAAEVARTVGWPNAKAVYNHVYRSLGVIRHLFERRGIRREDL